MDTESLGFILACLTLSACTDKSTANAPEPTVAVDVVNPAIDIASPVVAFPAVIRRDRESELSFRVGGQIRSMPIRIGDRLPRGAVVATLDATALAAARVRAEADAARLIRATRRNGELVAIGAIPRVRQQDDLSALAAARAVLTTARYDERSARVRMPFDGVVLSRDSEVGETVAPGQRLATVADLSSAMLARVQVSQDVASGLRVGDAATLRLPGSAAPIAALVARIGAAADSRTATTEVELRLPGSLRIVSGTVGSASFAPSARIAKVGLLLPAETLLDAKGGYGHVFVIDPRRPVARRTRVRFLGFEGDDVRVLGVASDAAVITSGAGFVSDGQRVKVGRR